MRYLLVTALLLLLAGCTEPECESCQATIDPPPHLKAPAADHKGKTE